MELVIGIIVFLTLLSIEGHLRKGSKQNEEIIELLREINEKQ